MKKIEDARTITGAMIYDEAREARLSIAEVLEILSTPAEGEDPMDALMRVLAQIVISQKQIRQQLNEIERRLRA